MPTRDYWQSAAKGAIMRTLDVFDKNNNDFFLACEFARKMYEEMLNFKLEKFPDFFVVLLDNGKVVGCIGMNMKVKNPLIEKNEDYIRLKKNLGEEVTFGEQNILAVNRDGFGILFLVASLAEYANLKGLDNLAFAATEIAFRSMRRLGMKIISCGLADRACIPDEDRPNYEKWFASNNPEVGVVDTAQIIGLNPHFFQRMSKRVVMTGTLAREIHDYRNKIRIEAV